MEKHLLLVSVANGLFLVSVANGLLLVKVANGLLFPENELAGILG